MIVILKKYIFGVKLKVRIIKFTSNFCFLGCINDYFIAVGVKYLGQTGFAKKNFFWTTSDSMKFAELPTPLTKECRSLFD